VAETNEYHMLAREQIVVSWDFAVLRRLTFACAQTTAAGSIDYRPARAEMPNPNSSTFLNDVGLSSDHFGS
jgi:hypothetical protein